MIIDLHCHSTASDGAYTPERVALEVYSAGTRWAALTDHNTTCGQARFREALEHYGVGCITGVEMAAYTAEGPVHLLAYGFDPFHARLESALHVTRSPVNWLLQRLAARLRWRLRGEPLPAFASEAGDVAGLRYTQGRLEFADAAALVHQAGGLVFLAHPLTRLTTGQLDWLLDALPPLGLDGIEAVYKSYPPEACRDLRRRAESRGLLVSAGSDYHGPHPHHAETPGVEAPDDLVERLLDAL